jgi:hypothetical protein
MNDKLKRRETQSATAAQGSSRSRDASSQKGQRNARDVGAPCKAAIGKEYRDWGIERGRLRGYEQKPRRSQRKVSAID